MSTLLCNHTGHVPSHGQFDFQYLWKANSTDSQVEVNTAKTQRKTKGELKEEKQELEEHEADGEESPRLDLTCKRFIVQILGRVKGEGRRRRGV